MRLLDMYGPNGTAAPGRLSQKTVDICLKPIFRYAKNIPPRWEYKKSKTWDVYESENHHAMSFTTCWQFARIARNHPDYKDIKYRGFTPAEHYEAWNKYFVADGTIADAGQGNAGTATLAFTPEDDLVYTLDASYDLTQNDTWPAFGFANGQSKSDNTSLPNENRFLEGDTTGIAWMFAHADQGSSDAILGVSGVANGGLSNRVDWVGGPAGTGAFDLRIELDTTGGTGNWAATWYAKEQTASDYDEVRGTATLLDEAGIDSVGFGVGGAGVVGDISDFTLTSIPEPSSYALLASCFGLTWVMLRRRRS